MLNTFSSISALMGFEQDVGMRMKLLLFVDIDNGSMSNKMEIAEWSTRRALRVKYWLKTWQDVKKLESTLDFSDEPLINIMLPSGRSQDTITDPAVRKRYDEAVKKNDLKIEKSHKMRDIQDVCMQFYQRAEFYATRSYLIFPNELDELEKMLNLYVVDEAVRNRILENVKNRRMYSPRDR